MKTKFNLNNYLLDEDDLPHIQKPIIPVCLPKTPFRIHPDTERVATVLIHLIDKRWHLLNPQAVKTFAVPNLWKADLLEGIDKDGNTFILPSTMGSYRESMETVIRAARKQWVKMETIRDIQAHILTPIRTAISDPDWPEHPFDEVIEIAFRDRLINTYEDAAKLFEKKRSHRQA